MLKFTFTSCNYFSISLLITPTIGLTTLMPSPTDNTVQRLIIIILVLAVVCAVLVVTIVVISILAHTFLKKLKKSRITVDSGMMYTCIHARWYSLMHTYMHTAIIQEITCMHAYSVHADMFIKYLHVYYNRLSSSS